MPRVLPLDRGILVVRCFGSPVQVAVRGAAVRCAVVVILTIRAGLVGSFRGATIAASTEHVLYFFRSRDVVFSSAVVGGA